MKYMHNLKDQMDCVRLIAMALVGSLLLSCKQDADLLPDPSGALTENRLLVANKLHEYAFDTTGMELCDDYVTVEGCIVLPVDYLMKLPSCTERDSGDYSELEELQQIYDVGDTNILWRQYVINKATLVSMANISNIKFYIHPGVATITPGGAEWVTAIRQAAQDWENITNCKINFTEVYNSSDAALKIYSDENPPAPCMGNLPSNTWARAIFPINNKVGFWISINNPSISLAFKKTTMRHEIGHTLGFRHDNAPGIGEPTNATGACGYSINGMNRLTGTPLLDASSVMVTPAGLANVLSANDQKAARYMYPDPYTTPVINSHTVINNGGNSRTVKLYVNSSNVIPYEVIVTRHSTTSSSILQTNSFLDPNNNSSVYSVSAPIGTWRFRVWRRNYGNYYLISNYRTVVVN